MDFNVGDTVYFNGEKVTIISTIEDMKVVIQHKTGNYEEVDITYLAYTDRRRK